MAVAEQAGPSGGWLPAITFAVTAPCTASGAQIAVSSAASLPRDMPVTAVGPRGGMAARGSEVRQ